MKQFEIPEFYRSPIISKVKAFRKSNDPRKKDFAPTELKIGAHSLFIPRHFGFCYGVENAIEIAYKAVHENPDKRIFLLSQMIHNPAVNQDLESHGIRFIQDTHGTQLIPWNDLTADDVVIIPAFGTTLEIEQILKNLKLDVQKYNTTCPFVEKVWNRAEKLGSDQYTLVIHGKYNHEETRATFSHTAANSPAVIVKDIEEAKLLADVITGKKSKAEFYALFSGKYSIGFDPEIDFDRIGVINQTTMLATETQEIADFLKATVEEYNRQSTQLKTFADTRDTLCYATNDNQSATIELLKQPLDFAMVVGGYNSSNTTHLVELLEQKCPVFFIKDDTEMVGTEIHHFDIHQHEVKVSKNWLENLNTNRIAISSGASCPDVIVEKVIRKLMKLLQVNDAELEQGLADLK